MAGAIRSIYLPWAEDSARYLQKLVAELEYPGGNFSSDEKEKYMEGSCLLFVDGLRFDLARRLSKKLEEKGLIVDETPHWSALPSVTATGKPAVSPVRKRIIGEESNADFEPRVAETGQPMKGGLSL